MEAIGQAWNSSLLSKDMCVCCISALGACHSTAFTYCTLNMHPSRFDDLHV